MEAASFEQFCREHRLLEALGGGVVRGALSILFARGLESSLGGTSEESDFQLLGVGALIGAAATGIVCAVSTGTLWYRALLGVWEEIGPALLAVGMFAFVSASIARVYRVRAWWAMARTVGVSLERW